MAHQFANIERHRQKLTENVAKLDKALAYWREWEVEYLGLIEELEGKPDKEISQAELVTLAEQTGSTQLTEKEIRSMIDKPKKASDIIAILARRIDYVRQNVSTLQKQRDAAQVQLEAAAEVLKDVSTEEGLPLMEIVEELDEEGNVISSSTTAAADKAGELVETLQKVGVLDAPKSDKESQNTIEDPDTQVVEPSTVSQSTAETRQPEKGKGPQPLSDTLPQAVQPGTQLQKSTDEQKKSSEEDEFAVFLKTPEGARFIVLDDNDEYVAGPIIPKDESKADAALRQEMLEYNSKENRLQEVQNIVAEIDLDEDAECEITDDDLTEDDEEDGHIRPRKSWLDPAYIAEMKALDERLNGKRPEPVPKAASRHITESGDMQSIPSPPSLLKSDSKSTGKKGVRFAEELDIAPVPASVLPKAPVALDAIASSDRPIQDKITERLPPSSSSSTALPSLPSRTRVSKFKAQRQAPAQSPDLPSPDQTTPEPPTKRRHLQQQPTPLSKDIIEHAPPSSTSQTDDQNQTDSSPSLPTDYNEHLHQQEIATEYHRQRNKRIHAQGGFLQNEDDSDEEQERILADDSEQPRQSRFMAARLKRLGGQ